MEITIRDEFIKLGQALKLAGVVDDGVEAKQKQTHAKGVHNIGGQQVRTDSNTDGLQEGIYIVNGKKTLLKK